MKKRDRDIVRKRYFKEKTRQADLLNVLLRIQAKNETKQTEPYFIKGDDFALVSPELFTLIEAEDADYSRVRTVDIASMLCAEGRRFFFFIENQEKIDYTMPERLLSSESICYHEQVWQLKKMHRQNEDWTSREAKLCGINAEDRLIPIISVVVYYGSPKWNSFRKLSKMMKSDDKAGGLNTLVNDYEMHLIEVKQFEHLEWLQTDLHETFGFIRYADEEEKLHEFVHKNREAFKNLAEDAYDFITYQTGTRKFQQWKEEYRTEEGGYDMCKAIDDMMKHSREEGEKRGEKRGEDRMAELVRRLLSENRIQDVQKILKNKRYRGNMYKQYGL